MTSERFCYWLQGFLELAEPEKLTPKQVEVIKNHLSLVFEKPVDTGLPNAEYQKKLRELSQDPSRITISPSPLGRTYC